MMSWLHAAIANGAVTEGTHSQLVRVAFASHFPHFRPSLLPFGITSFAVVGSRCAQRYFTLLKWHFKRLFRPPFLFKKKKVIYLFISPKEKGDVTLNWSLPRVGRRPSAASVETSITPVLNGEGSHWLQDRRGTKKVWLASELHSLCAGGEMQWEDKADRS